MFVFLFPFCSEPFFFFLSPLPSTVIRLEPYVSLRLLSFPRVEVLAGPVVLLFLTVCECLLRYLASFFLCPALCSPPPFVPPDGRVPFFGTFVPFYSFLFCGSCSFRLSWTLLPCPFLVLTHLHSFWVETDLPPAFCLFSFKCVDFVSIHRPCIPPSRLGSCTRSLYLCSPRL